ncbi:PDK2 [Cordylochernes scorpioides]|uniref:Protein-serine/threonine kinase n=1 Tax=Cordylochernes scorpioides TaxID=51811 RepID=A0ABY6KYA1_9ARAC|nr:PDK2 [Cordylochernes scorpioides]
MNPTPLSLQRLIDFGKNALESNAFYFLRRELPIRLANIMQEFQYLPERLIKTPSIHELKSWYKKSFMELLEFETADCYSMENLRHFCHVISGINQRHAGLRRKMTQGIEEMGDKADIGEISERNIHYFLTRLYTTRISVRLLITQHNLLFDKKKWPPEQTLVGSIDTACDLVKIINNAYDDAKILCTKHFSACPHLEMDIVNFHGYQFTYVPFHLYIMLFELFKNSMRAVVEAHLDGKYPPIHVLVIRGNENICIKIQDKGGGIPRSQLGLMWKFWRTTSPETYAPGTEGSFTGTGDGLPLAQIYARYLQGNIILASYDGYGSDIIIYLKASASDMSEVLPVFNKECSKRYLEADISHDWSVPRHLLNPLISEEKL